MSERLPFSRHSSMKQNCIWSQNFHIPAQHVPLETTMTFIFSVEHKTAQKRTSSTDLLEDADSDVIADGGVPQKRCECVSFSLISQRDHTTERGRIAVCGQSGVKLRQAKDRRTAKARPPTVGDTYDQTIEEHARVTCRQRQIGEVANRDEH